MVPGWGGAFSLKTKTMIIATIMLARTTLQLQMVIHIFSAPTTILADTQNSSSFLALLPPDNFVLARPQLRCTCETSEARKPEPQKAAPDYLCPISRRDPFRR